MTLKPMSPRNLLSVDGLVNSVINQAKKEGMVPSGYEAAVNSKVSNDLVTVINQAAQNHISGKGNVFLEVWFRPSPHHPYFTRDTVCFKSRAIQLNCCQVTENIGREGAESICLPDVQVGCGQQYLAHFLLGLSSGDEKGTLGRYIQMLCDEEQFVGAGNIYVLAFGESYELPVFEGGWNEGFEFTPPAERMLFQVNLENQTLIYYE